MKNCKSMAAVRSEIDRLDRNIIALLAERSGYIRQAGTIKSSRDLVRDAARIEDVLAKVGAEAAARGLDAGLTEALYRLLIEHSIAYEFKVYDRHAASPGQGGAAPGAEKSG